MYRMSSPGCLTVVLELEPRSFAYSKLRIRSSMSSTLDTTLSLNEDPAYTVEASNRSLLSQLPSELLIGIIELVDNDHLDRRLCGIVPLANLRL